MLRRIQDRFEYRAQVRRNETRREFLRTVIPEGGVAAELGVHKGYFVPDILEVTKPKRLHLVDPWYLVGTEWSWGPGNRSTIAGLIGILKRLEADLSNGTVVLDIGYDLEVLRATPDGYFDWVYVDTTHMYDQTRRELELLRSKVKASGIIAGDDWRPDPRHRHHGVCRAVGEFVEREPYELIYSSEDDLQWAIRRNR